MLRFATSRRQAEVRAPPPIAHARHAPKRTLLSALVEALYPDILARLEAEDRALLERVREEFEDCRRPRHP